MNRLNEKGFWMSIRRRLNNDFMPSTGNLFWDQIKFRKKDKYILSKVNIKYLVQ